MVFWGEFFVLFVLKVFVDVLFDGFDLREF